MEEGKERRGGPERHFGKGWRQADADKDGSLTLEEFSHLPRIQNLPEEKRAHIFARFDKNKDGILSPDEMKVMMPRPPYEGSHAARMRFRELDTDKSGGVTFVELKAGELFKKLPVEKLEALFARLDTDKDGEITLKDRPAGPRHGPGRPDRPDRRDKESKVDRLDKGGKGGENRPPRDPRQMLKELDKNGDGSVSFEEFRKAPPVRDLGEDAQEDRFEALDKNGDKKLDEGDFPVPPKAE
jgi:Ca2+-binding EF-hand superfamily protein